MGLGAAQAAHAVIAHSRAEPFIGDQPTLVILSVPARLFDDGCGVENILQRKGLPYAVWQEPDLDDKLTAVAFMAKSSPINGKLLGC